MSTRLVAVDLDGTLIGSDLKISEADRAAIGHVVAAGLHIVLATGAEVPVGQLPPPMSEIEVPRVEHDGQWHTLH